MPASGPSSRRAASGGVASRRTPPGPDPITPERRGPAEAPPGLDGGPSPRLRREARRPAAGPSSALAREHLAELLGVSAAAETPRAYRGRRAGRVASWRGRETASAGAFRQAGGARGLAVDAGKVDTIEDGWRDPKIAVARRRPAAGPATPEERESRDPPGATARVKWADISAARRFRRSWHARPPRLGRPAMARPHVPGDGASWTWEAAGRASTGCRRTPDIFHAAEHIAGAGRRPPGEGTAGAARCHEHGREPPPKEGWAGVRRPIGEELASEDTPPRRRALDR